MLCVTAFRPRVAEIYENALDLGIIENLAELQCVHIDKADIFYSRVAYSFHGGDHRVCDLFNGDEHYIRVLLRRTGGKASFAAAELEPQLFIVRKAFSPHALERLGIFYLHLSASFHARYQVRFFSHSHKLASPLNKKYHKPNKTSILKYFGQTANIDALF